VCLNADKAVPRGKRDTVFAAWEAAARDSAARSTPIYAPLHPEGRQHRVEDGPRMVPKTKAKGRWPQKTSRVLHSVPRSIRGEALKVRPGDGDRPLPMYTRSPELRTTSDGMFDMKW